MDKRQKRRNSVNSRLLNYVGTGTPQLSKIGSREIMCRQVLRNRAQIKLNLQVMGEVFLLCCHLTTNIGNI